MAHSVISVHIRIHIRGVQISEQNIHLWTSSRVSMMTESDMTDLWVSTSPTTMIFDFSKYLMACSIDVNSVLVIQLLYTCLLQIFSVP